MAESKEKTFLVKIGLEVHGLREIDFSRGFDGSVVRGFG
jgi:hypothetical protein